MSDPTREQTDIITALRGPGDTNELPAVPPVGPGSHRRPRPGQPRTVALCVAGVCVLAGVACYTSYSIGTALKGHGSQTPTEAAVPAPSTRSATTAEAAPPQRSRTPRADRRRQRSTHPAPMPSTSAPKPHRTSPSPSPRKPPRTPKPSPSPSASDGPTTTPTPSPTLSASPTWTPPRGDHHGE